MLCQFCQNPAALVFGDAIYPHRPDLFFKRFWLCAPCNAYCGCHPGTETPLGTLADAATRKARSAAHAAFDRLWKGRVRNKGRGQWYAWLAKQMNMTKDECHIGMMTVAQCENVSRVCSEVR